MTATFDSEDISLYIPFIIDGEYVVPDVGSVSYTLRDHDGSVLLSNESVFTDALTTEVTVNIPGTHNAKTGDVENRFFRLTYQQDGRPHRITRTYQVVDFKPITANEDEVRDILGVNDAEVPDSHIDIIGAYWFLADDLQGTTLDDALTATNRKMLAANKAIAYKAALDLVPTLQMKAVQREVFDSNQYWRFQEIDWKAMRRDLAALLSQELAAVTGETQTPPTLLILSNRTDPITGN